jgi:hypothetical protein
MTTTPQTLSSLQISCVNYVRDEYALEDFNIRRSEFYQQQYRGEVFLWMVVVITISGVALAALQLYAAFRLAISGKMTSADGALLSDGELSIETGKISLRSSVAGLFILALSLAFFIGYVYWVYPVRQLQPDKASIADTAHPGVVLLPGFGRLAINNSTVSPSSAATGTPAAHEPTQPAISGTTPTP